MIKNKKNIENRIINALGNKKSDKQRFYVYALCDRNGLPFYIGKGESSRILSHKNNVLKLIEEEKKEIKKRKGTEQDFYFRELNEKENKIKTLLLKNKNDIQEVIIKYGLTEEESFMAESALINILKYIKKPKIDLTNIVNGHASDKEKESKSSIKTSARKIDVFLKECAPERLNIKKDIPKDMLQKSIFISIGKFGMNCDSENDYWDRVRGTWRMNFERAKKIEFIFVVYRKIIKKVFQIIPNNVSKVFSDNNINFMKIEDIGNEYKAAQAVAQIVAKYKKQNNKITKDKFIKKEGMFVFSRYQIKKSEKDSPLNSPESFKNWLAKIYFTKKVDIVDKNLEQLKKNIENKEINFDIPQISFRYGESLLNKK